MKVFFSFAMFVFLMVGKLLAQTDFHQAAENLKPKADFENVYVQKLFSDPKATGFVIWIKKSVGLHRHDFHSETVYVLKGKGTMTLGEKSFPIKAGDILFIPEGSPHAVVVKKGVLKVLSIQAPEFDGSDRILLY